LRTVKAGLLTLASSAPWKENKWDIICMHDFDRQDYLFFSIYALFFSICYLPIIYHWQTLIRLHENKKKIYRKEEYNDPNAAFVIAASCISLEYCVFNQLVSLIITLFFYEFI
jgi:hypothetical protein